MLPAPLRIVAGHALDAERFCIAVSGEPDADDPFTMLLIYEDGLSQPWERIDVRRIVVSVSSGNYVAEETECFTALSDEGDVWFLRDEDVPLEKIPGAGVHSEDATGRGPMTRLYGARNEHYAIGAGGQIYIRRAPGEWSELSPGAPPLMPEDGPLFLNALDLTDDGRLLAGGALFTQGAVDDAALDAALEAGDFDRYAELAVSGGGGQVGALFAVDAREWVRIDLPSNGRVLDIRQEIAATSLLIAMDMGLLFRFQNNTLIEEVSDGETAETLVSIAASDLGTIVASETALFTVAPGGLAEEPSLPEGGFTSIIAVEQAQSTLWVFDDQAVFRRERGEWTKISVPGAILAGPRGGA